MRNLLLQPLRVRHALASASLSMIPCIGQPTTLTTPLRYGQRYVLVFEMIGLRGSAKVRSLWIVRTGEDIPRLTSC